MGPARVLLLCQLAAVLAGAAVGRRARDPRLSRMARAVAAWSPCTGVSPWELSNLEDGDLMHSTDGGKALFPNRKWENRTLPFLIEMTDFTKEQIAEIREVVRRINKLSCVWLWEADSYTADYVKITGRDEGCYSEFWGRRGGQQRVNLQPPNCLERGTIFHTLFHTLGFRHMHSAPKRDDFISILWNNIAQEDHKHFGKYNNDEYYTDFGLRYDYDSLMHFSRRAHSANNFDTIETHDVSVTIGRRLGPSLIDIAKLKLLYECD